MSLTAGYFEDMYRGTDDPWSFRTRWYEERKRRSTLAALRRPHYRSAFEPGCSLGLLTAPLAQRCTQLLACDVSARALKAARHEVGENPHVHLMCRAVPGWWPTGPFDLIVVSEVGYYLDGDDSAALWRAARASLEPGGDLVAVHWRHPVADYPLSGDDVHRSLASTGGLASVVRHEEADFLLEVFTRVPPAPMSVAASEGLV